MSNIFKARLKAARESKSLTQSQLASIAGFQPSAISHFEVGNRAPSFENLKKLADALNVTTDYLLGRDFQLSISGPVVGSLLRHVEEISNEDLEMLESIAKTMAAKSHHRSGST